MKISSRDNDRIKFAVKLRDSAKARREERMFFIEGARLCRDAATGNAPVKTLMYTDRALEKYRREIETVAARAEEMFEISEEVSEKLSDTERPQGVFCICKILDNSQKIDTMFFEGKMLGLENVRDPANVGAIIRTAAALGAGGVIMCGCCDIYNPKALRASMGAVFRTSITVADDMCAVLRRCRECGVDSFAAVLSDRAQNVEDVKFGENVIVIIGNEGNGITDEVSRLCDSHIIIPMKNDVESLNASVAAGIIIYRLING